jgi:hypothetical protein
LTDPALLNVRHIHPFNPENHNLFLILECTTGLLTQTFVIPAKTKFQHKHPFNPDNKNSLLILGVNNALADTDLVIPAQTKKLT